MKIKQTINIKVGEISTWKLGLFGSPASKWGRSGIMIFAVAANILSVIIIDLAVVLIVLDKVSGFAILDVQPELLTPPALTLL